MTKNLLKSVIDLKKVIKKISEIMKLIFGYGIMTTLFTGGLTFFGFIVALIIGGDTASLICEIIYKHIFPVIIYVASATVLLGLAAMYLSGETALAPGKKK